LKPCGDYLAFVGRISGDHAALERLKKRELAVRATELVAGSGWRPEPLRVRADAPQERVALAAA
jgi:hypothetical protein